ncbi:MAG: type II secretion system F family protein [Alphaproteobacteria bacterium]|nr:type II secretion system F family protein [Alphaproteobacteria bacterium]MBV8549144.1 type II secretion system F family protein [Alphaproteobacteria bacterium]
MKLYHAKYVQGRAGANAQIVEEDFYMPDVSSVRRQLRSRGYWPISIKEQKPPMLEWMDVRSKNWQIQLLRALRFQSVTASAGTALLNIIEGETDKKRALAFLPTRTVLKGGGSFSEALRALRLMDAATMAIITAGERAGDLKGVIQHAIEHTEEKGKNLKVIITALSWLSFDIINIIGAIWGAQFGFIPYLRDQGIKTTDPDAVARFTHALNIASWVNGTLLAIVMLVCTGAVVFGGLYWMNRHRSDHFTSRILMKVPIVSAYLRNSSMQDTCKLMRRLLTGKVPLADAIDILIDSTFEPATRSYWVDCKKRILTGVEPARALGRWPLTKAEKDQIATIQAVDQLAEVYGSIAEERGLMAKADQRRLTQTGVFLMMFFFGATVLTMIYLLSIQNQGFLENLSTLKN